MVAKKTMATQAEKILRAIAVKQNLNALKEFAYSKGYVNQVGQYEDAVLAEMLKAKVTQGDAEAYLTAKYMGGRATGTRSSGSKLSQLAK